jgi:signal transduction histidine kinase
MRLFPKLLLAFFAVVLVGMLVVSFLANQATAREVRGFMFGSGMTTEAGLAQELAGYYRGHGSWEGVSLILRDTGHGLGMGHMMGQRAIVADANGVVVADTDEVLLGQSLSASESVTGIAIEVEGQRVGTLLARGGAGMMGGVPSVEADLLARVNRAIWLAALAAGAAALVVGSVMAYRLVRPIRRLTQATQAVARGDLSQRVAVTAKDEIGDLGAAFNAMTADLQKAERLRRDMTADIAHELRNPLAVLQGNLEAVLDGVLPPTEENLRPLLDQTQLLTRLVDDLRTLALADSGQLGLNRVPTDPAALVRSVAARFAPQAEVKHITLQADIGDDLPTLSLDAQRIEQVLGNLLSNALRHTPEGGRVVCRVMAQSAHDEKRHAPLVTLTVADTGPGIPPEVLPHIFERFYRVDRSRARAEGGTGLGLAIVKQLVEAHGGQIWAKSEPGSGTQVIFTLPL